MEERNRNFCKRGGDQVPKSPEKLAQDQRESTTLAVFHSSPADIPNSPKEPPPPPEMEDVASNETPFGEPAEQTQVSVSTLLNFCKLLTRHLRYSADKLNILPPEIHKNLLLRPILVRSTLHLSFG